MVLFLTFIFQNCSKIIVTTPKCDGENVSETVIDLIYEVDNIENNISEQEEVLNSLDSTYNVEINRDTINSYKEELEERYKNIRNREEGYLKNYQNELENIRRAKLTNIVTLEKNDEYKTCDCEAKVLLPNQNISTQTYNYRIKTDSEGKQIVEVYK
ncbi:hypothetical protein [Flavobacterium aurantiibacter]|uniref:Uncharacterized protein n=1 Tax=Flavobacterium aurantiibacter TaxID=2023067 RepID=A0A255ZE08_9FLAO|nr:hypothetical protein [Flavobacterium aurantiibacter]OYQ39641.1 hypothetical protein CHX27_14190 [Flavobacterium aurantiibacter]